MDPREFLSFVRRRWLPILVVSVLAGIFSFSYSARHEQIERGALIFVTLGMEMQEGALADSYVTNESRNVVDQFTETVQGWLFNPSLIDRISDLVGEDIELSVRKQERQNLLVTVIVPEDVGVNGAAEAVIEIMNEEIHAYNAATNTDFLIALSSISPFENAPQRGITVGVGVLLGLIFAILFLVVWEYSRRRVTFGFQVKSVVGSNPVGHLYGRFSNKQAEKWLKDHENWFSGKVESIFNSNEFKSSMRVGSFIFFVRLGETSEDDLRDVRQLVGESFDYVLIV